jgi:hypothetical protein
MQAVEVELWGVISIEAGRTGILIRRMSQKTGLIAIALSNGFSVRAASWQRSLRPSTHGQAIKLV